MQFGHTETRSGLSSKPIISDAAPRDELLARVRQLEAVLFSDEWIPSEWGLTRSEAMAFAAIANAGRPVTLPMLFDALYGLRTDGGPETVAAMRVIVSHVRTKVGRHGIVIPSLAHARRGSGYYLTPESRLVVDALRNGGAS